MTALSKISLGVTASVSFTETSFEELPLDLRDLWLCLIFFRDAAFDSSKLLPSVGEPVVDEFKNCYYSHYSFEIVFAADGFNQISCKTSRTTSLIAV